mmetsp:Transcript_8263/g.19413  ORF Transcript_8263/g.19413 Transcript_8263/m.19413 type:complete len:1040 (-) Transcript_8263:118-3237(-)
MSWQGAVDYWAEKAGCAELDFAGSSQQARVWTYSIIYGVTMTLLVTIPFRWCSGARRGIKIVQEPGDDEEGGSPAKKTKTMGSAEPELINPEPCLEDAKAHLCRTSATEDMKWMSPMCTPTYRLSEIGGTGTELYFRTLRNLGFIFAYMAAATGPIIGFCLLGNFGPDTGQFLLKTTIGNLGELVPAHILDPWSRVVRLGCEGAEITRFTGIFGWLDFAAIVIFLVYCVWARFIQIPRAAEQDELEQVTPKDYSVMIEGLPAKLADMEEHTKYEELLREHLLARINLARGRRQASRELPEAQVCELVLVRDYNGRLHELKDRADLVLRTEIADRRCAKSGKTKRKEKLQAQLEKMDFKLGTKLASEEELPVVRAYAILRCTDDVAGLLFDYRFANYKLFKCCQFRARRFQGSALRITQAPQPTDIIWENQDIPWYSRLWRQALVFIIFFIILSISLGLIYVTTVAGSATSKSQTSYLGVEECDPAGEQFDLDGNAQYKCMIQNATNWTQAYALNQGGDILSCWCTAQGYEKLIGDAGLLETCTPWLLELAMSIGIAFASSTVVMVINVVLQLVLVILAEFERPLSHTSLNSSMMKKAFWAQTLNTGFVLFFVNFWAPEVLREAVLVIPGVGFLLLRGDFAEITRGWYAVVGVTILMNMLLNAFVPACVTFAKMIVNVLMRCCFRSSVAHQAELLELYTNPEFDIKQKYAQLLTTVFVTVMYGSGLPLLYFLASIFMFFQYWADKYCLLWGSRRPPHYDTKMATEAIESMLYAIPFHCVLAILMYGQTCVFPSNQLGGTLGALADQGAGYTPGMIQQFIPQVTRESTWMFFCLFVLLVVLWVLWIVGWIIGGTASTAWDLLVAVCCPRWSRKQPTRAELEEALAKGERKVNGRSIDVASTMDWDVAEAHIDAKFPPASYRFEKHPALAAVAPLLRPQSRPNTARGDPETAAETGLRQAAEVAASNDAEAAAAPVEESVAKGFLKALDDEYVQFKGPTVGNFFDSEGHQDKLAAFEDKIRASDDKKAAIEALAKEWKVEFP